MCSALFNLVWLKNLSSIIKNELFLLRYVKRRDIANAFIEKFSHLQCYQVSIRCTFTIVCSYCIDTDEAPSVEE
jgi:hypothetical protein